mgnify:CR=1 FL=1
MVGLAPTFVNLLAAWLVISRAYILPEDVCRQLHHDLSTDLRLHCVCALLAISINNTSMGGRAAEPATFSSVPPGQ